ASVASRAARKQPVIVATNARRSIIMHWGGSVTNLRGNGLSMHLPAGSALTTDEVEHRVLPHPLGPCVWEARMLLIPVVDRFRRRRPVRAACGRNRLCREIEKDWRELIRTRRRRT